MRWKITTWLDHNLIGKLPKHIFQKKYLNLIFYENLKCIWSKKLLDYVNFHFYVISDLNKEAPISKWWVKNWKLRTQFTSWFCRNNNFWLLVLNFSLLNVKCKLNLKIQTQTREWFTFKTWYIVFTNLSALLNMIKLVQVNFDMAWKLIFLLWLLWMK